jgi:hypothetical protein
MLRRYGPCAFSPGEFPADTDGRADRRGLTRPPGDAREEAGRG